MVDYKFLGSRIRAIRLGQYRTEKSDRYRQV